MPRFLYQCGSCDNEFELDLPVSDRDFPVREICSRCGEREIYRVPGCGGFQLKGYCWSKDNYSRVLGDDPNYQKNYNRK